MTRSNRYLPIRDKITECEAALEGIYKAAHKVDQLIRLEKLRALKKKIK